MADLNDLQKDWDSQPTYSEEKMNEIATLVRTRSDSMRDILFKRDMAETASAVFIVACFAPALFFVKGTLAKAGIWIAIFGAIEIAALMNWVRSLDRADFAALPLKDFLASELRSLDRQIALLRYVAWWYLLPLYTGACLFTIGLDLAPDGTPFASSDFIFSIIFCSGYFVFCVFVWWINQRARKTQLQPLRDVLQRTYDSVTALESPELESDLISSLTAPELDVCQRKTSKKVIWALFGLFLSIGLIGMGVAAWYDIHSKRAPIQRARSTAPSGAPNEAQEPNGSSDTSHFDTATSVDALVTPLVEAGDLKGVSVGIVSFHALGEIESKTHHYGVVAYRDGKENPPRQPDDQTLYEVGGLSKVLTGILLASAVEKGEVMLDSPLSVLVPDNVEIPSYKNREMSLLDIITDRSGLPRLANNMPLSDWQDPYQNYTAIMAEEFLRRYKPKVSPGSKHVYSNFGAAYLGYVLTKIAGVNDYDTLLRERLTGPLGMQQTKVVLNEEQRQLPIGHDRRGKPTSAWHFADLPGAGGVRSSIEDMNRLMAACLQPTQSETGNAINLAFEKHADAPEQPMGLSWLISSDGSTRWHNGATGGFRAAMFVNREQGVGVCVLSNQSHDVITPVAKKIYEMETRTAETQDTR